MFGQLGRFVIVVIICFSVLAAGLLSAAQKLPAWVTGKTAYSEKDFIIGVGEGSSLNSARDSARAEISKVFETRIEQISKETQKESVSSGPKHQVVSEQQVELQTRSYSNQLLEGVNIAETFHDPKNNKFYALAVIDKRKVNADLSNQSLEQEEIIKTQLDAAAKAGKYSVEKIRSLAAALKAYDKKAQILRKKRIVEPVSVPDLSSGMSRAEISKVLSDTASQLSFIVKSKNDNSYGMDNVLTAQITKAGFRLSTKDDTNPSFMIEYSIELKPVDRGNVGVKFVNWQGSLSVVLHEKVLASSAPQGQVSGPNDDLAVQKAVLVAKQEMGNALEKAIRSYFFGE